MSSEWQPSMRKMEGLTISVINTKSLIAENRDAEASKELPKKDLFQKSRKKKSSDADGLNCVEHTTKN